MKKLVLLLASCLLLTGCIPATELQERAIIQAVGIDYFEGEYTLTFQVFIPESSGQQGLDVSKANNKIIESKGASISEAVRNATIEHGKKMFLGSNNLIVVGKYTAESGLNHVLNFFNSNHEANPKSIVVVSETTASDVVAVQTTQGIVPAHATEMIVKRAYKTGGSTKSRLFDLTKAFNTYGDSGCISYVRKGKNFYGADEITLVGSAVFIDDQMISSINPHETRGVLWGTGNVEHTILTVSNESIGDVSLSISNNKRKLKTELENGVPKFTLDISVVGTIYEAITDHGGVRLEEVEKIKEMTAYRIESEVHDALENSLRTDGADLFGFSLALKKYEKEFWNANKEQMNEVLKTAIVDVNVKVDIDRMGIQSVTNKK